MFLYGLWFFFNYSVNFIIFIVVQQSLSQPNFIGFPTHTPSASPHSPNCVLWRPELFQSLWDDPFCKEVHCVLFKIPHVSDSIWCWCLTVWLTSPSMIISRSIHVATNAIISFLLMAESYSIVSMYHIVLVHSSVDGHWGCFHVLAIANEHWSICVFVSCGFLWIDAQEWDCWIKW